MNRKIKLYSTDEVIDLYKEEDVGIFRKIQAEIMYDMGPAHENVLNPYKLCFIDDLRRQIMESGDIKGFYGSDKVDHDYNRNLVSAIKAIINWEVE